MNGTSVRVADGIWILEGGIVPFMGCAYSTRSVVVRLPSGALWVWSPIELTPEIRAAVDELGTPAHLVSPNNIHHLFLGDWKAAWPEARIWGPQSTIDKRSDIRFEAGLDNDVPASWEDTLDMVHFTGSFMVDELVFLHRPSRTVILADLSENFSKDFLKAHWKPWQRVMAHLAGVVEGKGYTPIDYRLSFLKRGKARQAKAEVLSWQPERVIMAHGVWQKHNGTAFLERALSWL